MINRFCWILLIIFLCCADYGLTQVKNWEQDEEYYLSPTVYSSPENPYYWKRRKPSADYWQQDIHYRILCNLRPDSNLIEGRESLTYRNNSTNKLEFVYFHLYQNAFTPDSYLDKYERQNGDKIDYGVHGNDGKGTLIHSLKQNEKIVQYEIDNTLMKVYLNQPLDPGESTTFDIQFTTYFSAGNSDNRRMKIISEKIQKENGEIYSVNHYDVVHWYPRIAVYDSRFLWNTAQHLGHEFYGNFGSYDVHINIPEYYILEATGILQNQNEALPDTLLRKINIQNYRNPGKYAQELIPANNEKTKQWVFHAMNVHDFAFTADPTYRRGEIVIGGVRCVSMARERNAGGWQDAAEYCAKFIQFYSQEFGKYLYLKMVVADADDGMEYPMLTLDGGSSPGYYSLFAHEIGHNWFYGMVGTNETYRAFMDEGFTQFLTVWAMEKIVGDYDPILAPYTRLTGKIPTRFLEAYGPYLERAIHRDAGVLNTHSDDFGGKENSPDYGQVYTKTAVMMYNLKYVLGEDVFLNAMRYYFNKWKIKHPYPEDFRKAIIEYTQSDLNWFFDQWLDTDKHIDYAVHSVRPRPGKKTAITFARKGGMQMPLEFTAFTKKGNISYYIPISEFVRQDSSLIVLPKWFSKGNLNPQYTVILDHRVRAVQIDPKHELADINLLNNRSKTPYKLSVGLFSKPDIFGKWEHYPINIRPYLWWNGFSGLQAGFTVEGKYLKEIHRIKARLWYNSGIGTIRSSHLALQPFEKDFQKICYQLEWSSLIPEWGKAAYASIVSRWTDGLHHHSAGFSYKKPKSGYDDGIYSRIYAKYTFMYRYPEAMKDYLILPENWTIAKSNASLILGFERNYVMSSGHGNWDIHLRTVAPAGQMTFAYLTSTLLNTLKIGKFNLQHRLFGRYGTGNLPKESALYLYGGSPEEMYQNPFYRSRGFFPYAWSVSPNFKTGHAHFGGGLGLRGYTGTQGALMDGGTTEWYGSAGFATNIELDFGGLLSLWRNSQIAEILKYRTYLFYDSGILGKNIPDNDRIIEKTRWGILHHDAGIGMSLDIGNEKFGIKNISVRTDFPIWVSLPSGGQKPLAFRWIIAISKPF